MTSFTVVTLADRLRAALQRRGGDLAAVYARFLSDGASFGARVARALAALPLVPGQDALFTYNTGALEPLLELSGRGIDTLLSQIDPGRVEEALVEEERARWPGWEGAGERVPAAYFERMEREWSAASRVLVNSEWSRRALIEQGVAPAKLVVVPLAYEPAGAPPTRRIRRGRLRVLWLGLVCLRKGIPYLLEAARRLTDRPVEFTIAGPLHVTAAAVAHAPPNVRFVGRIPRDQTARVYAEADLFVFPTLSDGFGITQLEAMAQGLPVISTPHCGEVVTDGVDGRVVAARAPEALAAAIAALDEDRPLLAAMSAAAGAKARTFGLERFARGLERALPEGDFAA
ncbi:MAG: glycosyltransferase family 4 protein [Planctomycetes bacterium]|nr:glycosyltransferase family 4 protein [Planctomycetota bacterium]